GALRPAGNEPHLLVLRLRLFRPVTRSGGIFCLALAGVLERHLANEEWCAVLRNPAACEGVGEDDLPVRHDLEILPRVLELLAIRRAHGDVGDAARTHIVLDLRGRPRSWREPLLHQLRLGPAAIELLLRRIED